jgi:hypothetical protein
LRAGKSVAILLALGMVAASAQLSAHRRDELLQAARIAIEPGRVELRLDLTPGIEVADSAIADLDCNRDGALSWDEKRRYVAHVVEAVALDVDGIAVRLAPTASTFPDVHAFARGEGTIQLRAEATLPPLAIGAHRLSYRNRNRPDISVYLANALLPDDDRVAVHAQRRDTDQRDLTIDYELRAQPDPTGAAWPLVSLFAVVGVILGGVYRRRPSIAGGQS